jgi:hypothetical protein
MNSLGSYDVVPLADDKSCIAADKEISVLQEAILAWRQAIAPETFIDNVVRNTLHPEIRDRVQAMGEPLVGKLVGGQYHASHYWEGVQPQKTLRRQRKPHSNPMFLGVVAGFDLAGNKGNLDSELHFAIGLKPICSLETEDKGIALPNGLAGFRFHPLWRKPKPADRAPGQPTDVWLPLEDTYINQPPRDLLWFRKGEKPTEVV